MSVNSLERYFAENFRAKRDHLVGRRFLSRHGKCLELDAGQRGRLDVELFDVDGEFLDQLADDAGVERFAGFDVAADEVEGLPFAIPLREELRTGCGFAFDPGEGGGDLTHWRTLEG